MSKIPNLLDSARVVSEYIRKMEKKASRRRAYRARKREKDLNNK